MEYHKPGTVLSKTLTEEELNRLEILERKRIMSSGEIDGEILSAFRKIRYRLFKKVITRKELFPIEASDEIPKSGIDNMDKG